MRAVSLLLIFYQKPRRFVAALQAIALSVFGFATGSCKAFQPFHLSFHTPFAFFPRGIFSDFRRAT
jgi:hypothetical protein